MTNYTNTRMAALLLIDAERNRQDAKWGEQNHVPQCWAGILGEEFGEYCQAVNETVFNNGPKERLKGGADNMIKELTHVAAVAVGAIECLMRAEAKSKTEFQTFEESICNLAQAASKAGYSLTEGENDTPTTTETTFYDGFGELVMRKTEEMPKGRS